MEELQRKDSERESSPLPSASSPRRGLDRWELGLLEAGSWKLEASSWPPHACRGPGGWPSSAFLAYQGAGLEGTQPGFKPVAVWGVGLLLRHSAGTKALTMLCNRYTCF